MNTDLSFEQVL